MAKIFKGIVRYFQESYEELRKVTWLTRNKAIRLTFIVLGFCLVSAAVMGVLDLGFNRGYQFLISYALRVVPPAAVTTTPTTSTTPTTGSISHTTTTPSPTSATPDIKVDATGPVKVETVPVSPTPSN